MNRRFVDAPQAKRCTADITLRDGSAAQCGRYRKAGTLCIQHAKIAEGRSVMAIRWQAKSK